MPAVAQGINKTLSIGRQTALGTPKIGAGCQKLRRRTSIFTAMRDMFESDEIVSHHQSTGVAYGLKKIEGKLSALLSSLTYQLPFEGLLQAVFATPVTMTNATTAMATATTLTDTGNAFLTTGFKTGDVIRCTGFTGAGVTANNSRNLLVTSVVAGTMGVIALDGTTLIADALGESVTTAVIGKKCKPPLTAHTNDYFTFEEWYSDISKSELFTDCRISSIALDLPATGNAGLEIDIVGLGRTLAGAQAQTSPTAETTTGIMSAINGFIYINGVAAGNMTGAKIQISDGAEGVGAVVGSNSSPDVSRGRIKVSGSFTGLFDATTFQAFYDAETIVSLTLVLTADNTATANFIGLTMGQIKITGDAPDDGEKGIVRTYPFTAQLNATGGAALAFDQTIITVQDSAAV